MGDGVYQSDPGRAPDSQFLPGELRHLVAGNRGRLLDLRRTPVHVTRVLPAAGFFEVEIGAFEDAGARWLVPLEDVASYQFATVGRTAGGAVLDELRDAAARYDIQVTVGGSGRKTPLVSASFSRRVAESHFGSPGAAAGALYRQPLQPDRLFMTFLETGAMDRQYQEAEAVLLAGGGPFF